MRTYKRRKSNQHVYNQWLGEPGSKRNPVQASPKLFRIIENGRWYSQMLSEMFKKLKERPADYWVKENQRKIDLYGKGEQNYDEYKIDMKANLGFVFHGADKNSFPKV